MSKKLFSLVVSVFAIVFVFFACDQLPVDKLPEADNNELSGYWKSSFGDGFDLSGDTYTQYDDADKHVSFAGTFDESTDLTQSSLYLTIKITDGGTWFKTVGYYYTIHFKNIRAGTCQMSAAYKDSGLSDASSDDIANEEFTVANGYFGFYSDCVKQ